MGKPMGNGYPLAGSGPAARGRLPNSLPKASRYFNTFGGNAVAAAVGLAVLDVIRDEGLHGKRRLRSGADFAAGLHTLDLACHATRSLGETVRGSWTLSSVSDHPGLAAAQPDPARTRRGMVNALREKRILISSTGPKGDSLKIRPAAGPFSLTEDVDQVLLDNGWTDVLRQTRSDQQGDFRVFRRKLVLRRPEFSAENSPPTTTPKVNETLPNGLTEKVIVIELAFRFQFFPPVDRSAQRIAQRRAQSCTGSIAPELHQRLFRRRPDMDVNRPGVDIDVAPPDQVQQLLAAENTRPGRSISVTRSLNSVGPSFSSLSSRNTRWVSGIQPDILMLQHHRPQSKAAPGAAAPWPAPSTPAPSRA